VNAIEPARRQDIPQLARIHAQALPDDFLPSLGVDFLTRVYYPAALADLSATTLVRRHAGRTVAFITVASDAQAFAHRILRQRFGSLIYYAMRAAFRRPLHLFRSLEVAAAASRGTATSVGTEIVFIAVHSDFQGQGIGPALVQAGMTRLGGEGKTCTTKTLASNTHVIRMYTSLGWTVSKSFRITGRDYVRLTSPKLW
jgi:ribosomal protein S18 acetylase RimI-like enzyme